MERSADLSPLSGVVLAGGQSKRLGVDKAMLRLEGPHGPTLLETTLTRLSAVCAEVLVVSDGPRDWPILPARTVFDRYPGGGVLGGIYTGLLEAAHPFVLAVACDMPFLQVNLLRYMAGLPRDYDVLIPRWRSPAGPAGRDDAREQVEPLHAIYGRTCLPAVRRALERGRRRIVSFFPEVRVRYLEEEEWRAYDPAGLSFRNVNTPQDLAQIGLRL